MTTVTMDRPLKPTFPVCKDGDADDKAVIGAEKKPGGIAGALPPPPSDDGPLPSLGGLLGGSAGGKGVCSGWVDEHGI